MTASGCPKRSGVRTTVNFSHRSSGWAMLGLSIVPLALLLGLVIYRVAVDDFERPRPTRQANATARPPCPALPTFPAFPAPGSPSSRLPQRDNRYVVFTTNWRLRPSGAPIVSVCSSS